MNRFLVLYEDRHWRSLRPLTDVLPVPALAFGASTLAQRWLDAARSAVPGLRLLAIESRPVPMAAWREAPALEIAHAASGDEVLALNAAALPGPWLGAALEGRVPALWLCAGRVAGACVPFEMAARGLGRGAEWESFLLSLALPGFAVEATFVHWPWNLLEWNARAITEDLARQEGAVRGEVDRLATLCEPGRITVAEGARVDALAVLDAREGPIRIGRGARVLPHTVVTGPCVVGAGTQLLGGFVGNSSIGPGCRIAGEVDACVWQGWSNKRHHGFVGHSAIAEWVNLGALTTTSDLKNNYGEVRVWVDGQEVASGSHKVGSVIGAHAKTGIGSLLPTGASIGVGANLFGGGRFAPKQVPAFAWWDGERVEEHRFDRFLETARIAMARRERPLLPADEAALRAAFDATAQERRAP